MLHKLSVSVKPERDRSVTSRFTLPNRRRNRQSRLNRFRVRLGDSSGQFYRPEIDNRGHVGRIVAERRRRRMNHGERLDLSRVG